MPSPSELARNEQPEHEPRPGEMHPIDQAFYQLAVEQRDRAWRECEAKQLVIDQLADALVIAYCPNSDRFGINVRRVIEEALNAAEGS